MDILSLLLNFLSTQKESAIAGGKGFLDQASRYGSFGEAAKNFPQFLKGFEQTQGAFPRTPTLASMTPLGQQEAPTGAPAGFTEPSMGFESTLVNPQAPAQLAARAAQPPPSPIRGMFNMLTGRGQQAEVPGTQPVFPEYKPTPEQAINTEQMELAKKQFGLHSEQFTEAKRAAGVGEAFREKEFGATEGERKAIQERHVDTIRKEWSNALGLHGFKTENGEKKRLNFKEIYQYANQMVKSGEAPANVEWDNQQNQPVSVMEWRAATEDAKNRPGSPFAKMSYPAWLKFDANVKREGITIKDAMAGAFKIEDDSRANANAIMIAKGKGGMVMGPAGTPQFQLKNPEQDIELYQKTLLNEYNKQAEHYSKNYGLKIAKKPEQEEAPSKKEGALEPSRTPTKEGKPTSKGTVRYLVPGEGIITLKPEEVAEFLKKYPNASRLN